MREPFERLLGDTSELRVLQYLLPLRGRDFNITQIALGADISRQAAIPVVKKFLKWGLLKVACKRGNASYYALNEDAGSVEALQILNNCIMDQMLGKKALTCIARYSSEHAPACGIKPAVRGRLRI